MSFSGLTMKEKLDEVLYPQQEEWTSLREQYLLPLVPEPLSPIFGFLTPLLAHLMYSQLQTRYPRASLVSELLQFQNGSYVVRVVVQVGEVTITSGMAASPSIEAAEDQARLRALAVLGIHPLGHKLQAPLIVQADAPDQEQQPLLNQPAQRSLDQSPLAPRNPASTEPSATGLSGGYPDPGEDVQEGLKSLEVISTTRGEPKFFDPQSRRRNEKANQGLKPDQNGRQHLKTALQTDAQPVPVDLSDTIAQTSVELKRLGWSDVQGRNYLQQTYGKRSRSSLTDEELLEFLQHLQAQPPTDEPF